MLSRLTRFSTLRVLVVSLVAAVILSLALGFAGAQMTAAEGPGKGDSANYYWWFVPVRYVVIGDNYYWPNVTYVPRNSVIIWVNNGQNVHTVTSGTPAGKAAPSIKELESMAAPDEGLPERSGPPAGVKLPSVEETKADATTFDSGDLNYADGFNYTFRERGVFYYHCEHHPNMRGIVVVY